MSRRASIQKQLDPLARYATMIQVLVRFKERVENIKGKVGTVLDAHLPNGETPVPSSWYAPHGAHWLAYDGERYIRVNFVRLVQD